MKQPRNAFVTVSMPPPLRKRIAAKLKHSGTYGSTSDYIRDLVRRDLDRDQAMAKFDELITAGANSPGQLVTEHWWKDLRAEIAERRRQGT